MSNSLTVSSSADYLWAVGAADLAVGATIGDRYLVKAPQIWLDTKVALPDAAPLPQLALPYLHLYPQRLHIPEVRNVFDEGRSLILLLQNAPIDASGQLFPALSATWVKVPPVRQVYWLWQLLDLWMPLRAQGVASSLLMPENLRVEGWRVRLCELCADVEPPQLSDLARLWLTWVGEPSTALPLQVICRQMQTVENSELGLKTIAAQLNALLLEQAAQLPLRLNVATASTTGPQRAHNEDTCYPPPSHTPAIDPFIPQLAIVCDGVGGHAGGEVASQLAVRSLHLQIRALLTELAEQTELLSPDVVSQQLESIVRVANNLIATQNDEQGRESRQRMGTTLVMALQLPQRAPTGEGNSHELYLVNVGDSRAYWITPRYCHKLTIDDDVATREVRLGKSLYEEALKRSDGGALTQALGTRDADFLRPSIQRFVIEEDGVLLLCSDGLSDNDVVERSWAEITQPLFKGKSLAAAVQSWVELANQQNGHDNTSVVLLQCLVSPDAPLLFEPAELPKMPSPQSELSEASKALLYGEEVTPATVGRSPKPALSPWAIRVGLAVLLVAAGALGVAAWRHSDPAGFDRTIQRVFQPNTQPNSPQPSPSSLPSP